MIQKKGDPRKKSRVEEWRGRLGGTVIVHGSKNRCTLNTLFRIILKSADFLKFHDQDRVQHCKIDD